MTRQALAAFLRRPIPLPRNRRAEASPLLGLVAVVLFLFRGAVRVADGTKAIETLVDPGFDPRRELILADAAARADATFSGTSRIVDFKPDRVRLVADLSASGYVVLLDAHDPGWRAWVDGRETPVLRANVAFRAVHAPQGHHVVELVYRPAAVLVGSLVSATTLLAGFALMVRESRSA